ncbi:RHS repeat protein, partial [Massilia genomosp. 1]
MKKTTMKTSVARASASVKFLCALAGLVLSVTMGFGHAQTKVSPNGVSISIPNGTATIMVDDMKLSSTAGTVSWGRVWTGKEWKFNPHWESLSQSWANLTGSSSTSSSAPAMLGKPMDGEESKACWVMVDEDWKPSTGLVLIGDKPIGIAMLSERTTPFNSLMGEKDKEDYPTPRLVSSDYFSLCMHGDAQKTAPVRDLEAVRRKNELYTGEQGRYAFSNRTMLDKRAVNAVPDTASAAAYTQLAAGSMIVAPVKIANGYRWSDKTGEWVDYNTQGQVVAYGDKNNNTVWMVRDKGGTLRGVIDANGRVLYSLHYTGNLITEVRDYPIAGMALDLPARSVKYKYDAANRLHEVIDARGNSMFYEYDTSNNIITVTDQEKRIEKLAYAGGSVTQYTAGDGGVSDYEFDYDDANKQFSTRITGPKTASGRRVDDLTHDRSGKLVRRVVNGRVDEAVRYDSGARAETSTNARGFSKRTAYNEFEQVVELTQEDGTTLKRAYSAINLALLETTDELGVKTRYERDGKGNLIRLVEAAGTADERVTESKVDDYGFTTITTVKGRTEANGTVTADAVTLTSYDAHGNIATVTEPEQGHFIFVHDRTGNRVSSTDPRKFTSVMQYDAMGLLVKRTNALNKSWRLARDKVGNLLVTTDPLEHKTTMRYDALNRVLDSAAASLTPATVGYDRQGSPTVVRDGDGREQLIEYDNFQRMSKLVDGMGNATRFSYQIDDGSAVGTLGSLNSPTEIRYPTYVQRNRYDALEHPTASTLAERNGVTHTVQTGYDPRGLVNGNIDPYGKADTTQHDHFGQPLTHTDRLKKLTRMAYDVRGNLLEVTDAKGNVHRFAYDRNGRVIKETLPLGQSAHLSYDLSGNVEQYIDFNQGKTRFTYDNANRLVKKLFYDKSDVLQRTVKYDWNDADSLIGWSNDDAGTQSSGIIAYDDANRHTGETVTYPGGFTMGYSYSYSPGGKKIALKWPDGGVVGYGYSKHGELDSVEVPGEGRISVSAFNWTAPSTAIL